MYCEPMIDVGASVQESTVKRSLCMHVTVHVTCKYSFMRSFFPECT